MIRWLLETDAVLVVAPKQVIPFIPLTANQAVTGSGDQVRFSRCPQSFQQRRPGIHQAWHGEPGWPRKPWISKNSEGV